MSSLHSQEGKDKEALEEDYQKSLEQIFTNGYGCCALKHNILDYLARILDGMPDSTDPLPPEFFVNLGRPLSLTAIEAKAAKAHPSEEVKDPVEDIMAEEQN